MGRFIKTWLISCIVASIGGCRVVDSIAPRQMTVTFEPASMAVTAQRTSVLIGGSFVSQYTCPFDAAIQAHGGGPSDYLRLVGVITTFFDASGTPGNELIDRAEDWFGSNELKYDERSIARRQVFAYGAFSVRIELKYVDPDAATRVETMTLVCQ